MTSRRKEPATDEIAPLDIGPRRRRSRKRAGLAVPDPVPTPAEMKDGPLVLTRAFPVLQAEQDR